MSRSRRHNPIAGVDTAESEAWWKRHWAHQRRRACKLAVIRGDELLDVPVREPRKYGPKDGKRRFDQGWMTDDELEARIMRK